MLFKKDLKLIRHVAVDMDGTIYNGGTLFETTKPFLTLLEDLGIGHTFLTNNPSKSADDYLACLHGLGIRATREQLYTAAHATIEFLRQDYPEARRLFVLGTPSMKQEFAAASFEIATDSPDENPDAVVVGFDMTLTYANLCRAAWWIKQGRPYFATNPDRFCPTDQPLVLVDCGAITAALEKATGRAPDMVLGKPNRAMLNGIMHRYQLQPAELAMVGDRLQTDIQMAQNAGALGVLVLSGDTTAAEAARHFPQPDLVVSTLAEFGKELQEAREQALSVLP